MSFNFGKMMEEAQQAMENSEKLKDRVPSHMIAAINRKKLENLTPGDLLIQKRLGEDYRYKGDLTPCVFVRYATPADRPPQQYGKQIRVPDVIIATCIDEQDGELVQFAVESEFYEKIDPAQLN